MTNHKHELLEVVEWHVLNMRNKLIYNLDKKQLQPSDAGRSEKNLRLCECIKHLISMQRQIKKRTHMG